MDRCGDPESVHEDDAGDVHADPIRGEREVAYAVVASLGHDGGNFAGDGVHLIRGERACHQPGEGRPGQKLGANV